MGNHLIQTEDKLFMFMKHAPSGMIEIDRTGTIIYINPSGELMLKPVVATLNFQSNNFFDILLFIAAETADEIKHFIAEAGITKNEYAKAFPFSFGTGKMEMHFNLVVSKLTDNSFIIYIEDYAEKHSGNKIIKKALLEKAVVQGKFEIASNVLHDVGNAVVGFSSYLTRIKRSLELDNSENLQNLVGFFETQKDPISTAVGEAKADAIIKIISGIAQTQKNNQKDIGKSITEQQNIINHIQEILNIQRQYVNGAEIIEKKPTNLSSIINDCMSMIYASLNKRNIIITLDINENLPVIKGDRTKLMQVILNILKNSIEAIDIYAADKSITITADSCNEFLVLKIKDSGKGFDEEIAKQLFTRGFTTKSSGSGLGLDHCRAILEGHGGTIDITSEGPDRGALTIMKFKI